MLAHLFNGSVPAGHVLECCEKELPQAIHLFMQLCLLLLFPPFQISPAVLFSLVSSLHFLKGNSGKIGTGRGLGCRAEAPRAGASALAPVRRALTHSLHPPLLRACLHTMGGLRQHSLLGTHAYPVLISM